MTRQWEHMGEFRAASTLREPENAKCSFHTGTAGVFIRVALAVVFMYLTVISFLVLGVAGPVFISALFLVALFVPFFYQAWKDLLEPRRAPREGHIVGEESRQEG